MRCPSQDGAFLIEAQQVEDVSDYLGRFPGRARTPPAQMRGTRAVSNPPGTTLLAAGTTALLARSPRLAGWVDPTTEADQLTPIQHKQAVEALAFAWVLTGLWLASVPFFNLAGRVFLPAAGAAALAVCCLVSPMTLAFTPGKDPAQLLSVAAPLWLWLSAYRRWERSGTHRAAGFSQRGAPNTMILRRTRSRWWPAALAGGLFTVACMVSLVHVWIAAIVLAASALHARQTPGESRRFWRRVCLPAAVGAVAVSLVLLLVWDCNILATAWAVARTQTEVTRGPEAMPLIWQMLGIPLFVLLAGPACWCGVLWLKGDRIADHHGRLGLYLLVGSAGVMLATVGFTSMETLRLWIPFVPLLLLGLALQLGEFRHRGGRAQFLLAALVFAQTVCSAAQWSLLDVREAEMRLSTPAPRFFD